MVPHLSPSGESPLPAAVKGKQTSLYETDSLFRAMVDDGLVVEARQSVSDCINTLSTSGSFIGVGNGDKE